MPAKFSILERISGSRARIMDNRLIDKDVGHLLNSEDVVKLAVEAAEQPCQIVARHRHDGSHDVIDITIAYQPYKD